MGIIIGIIVGIAIPALATGLSFLGQLFVMALKMLIAPLILSSIFIGISSIGDIRKLGSLGSQTVIYYLSTTFIAVIIGIIVVNIVNPGANQNIEIKQADISYSEEKLKENGLSLSEVYRQDNKAKTLIDKYKLTEDWIKLSEKENQSAVLKLESSLREAGVSKQNLKAISERAQDYVKALITIAKLKNRGLEITNSDVKRTISAVQKKTSLSDALLELVKNMLMNPFKALSEGNAIGIILFALLIGAFATTTGEAGKAVIRFMDGFNQIMFKIVDLIIKAAPVGVFSLIASLIAENAENGEKLALLASNVGWYMLTVLLGILIHALVVLPLLLKFFGKMSPLTFFKGMRSALLTAFSTCTSGGTLPLTFKATQVNLKLPKRVTDFVLPLGATVNMDGTALYESVAVIFIANFLGFELSIADQVIIFFTASIAAIGAATIPSAGLITMTIVLSAVGLPTAGIAIIMAVDRFLDMFRTACNVEGDAVGSAIISNLQRNKEEVIKT